MNRSNQGIAFGLLAAALFGASTPLSKALLPGTGPLMLAALLYLGGGTAISAARLALHWRKQAATEAALGRADLPLLVGVIVLGGMVAPGLMMFGLQTVSGVTASLLLNLEAPFTVLLALTLFGERLNRREVFAMACILTGAAVLSLAPGPWDTTLRGMLALAGACCAWALDNNFSQRLSGKDLLQLVQVKVLSAGVGMLVLAFLVGHAVPSLSIILWALLLGSVSYGLSLLFDMYALRFIGAARESAIFATAPFIGALLSLPVLGETLGPSHLVAGVAMAGGVYLLVRAGRIPWPMLRAVGHVSGAVNVELTKKGRPPV